MEAELQLVTLHYFQALSWILYISFSGREYGFIILSMLRFVFFVCLQMSSTWEAALWSYRTGIQILDGGIKKADTALASAQLTFLTCWKAHLDDEAQMNGLT